MTEAVHRAPADPEGRDEEVTPAKEPKNASRNAIEWVAIVVGALAVALVVKTFFIQAFYIPSGSMFSTLDVGDRVLVNKLSYRLHEVHRGDLVVFEKPDSVQDTGIKDLVKRVVALEGEVIEGRDGKVHIDGKPLPENYLDEGTITADFPRQTIPDGHVFVMGDNRARSQDSRFFDAIDTDLIVGRAFVRVWPLPDIDLL